MPARRFVCFTLTLATLALVCSIRTARANGRFPLAQAIVSVPGGDGQTLYLRATFGLLVSKDAGKTWRWVCERALGYEGQWDPPIAATHDGRLWIGLERGLVSTADGCTMDPSPELDGETIKDLTTDPKGETLWALTGTPDKRGAVWRLSIAKRDGGAAAWERTGFLPESFNTTTIEVAPSKPSRVYVSGQPYGTMRGWLMRSDDGGKTFSGTKNDLEAMGPFFIAAVDPKDPNRVLVRHLHTTGSDVLVTTDGKAFKNVLSMKSAMFGFAKSPDGSTYWAGSGLAVDGVFRSTDRGEHFERVSNHGVLCLHAISNDRLFVCDNPFTLGASAIALSNDQGKTLQSIATFGDIQGPLACKSDVCGGSWGETLASLVPRDAGPTGPSTRSLREAGVSAGDPPSRSTCGCTVAGDPASSLDLVWLTTGLVPLVMRGRARTRRGSGLSHRGRRHTT
ncbi:MAG: hypothetical protein KF819_12800 [Labilithrix sp.]|nr:hypothetical protein [Labilithrix sp.]